MGRIEDAYGFDFAFDRFCGTYIRTILKQIDFLLEERDSELDEFGLGVIQGLCMAAGVRHKMEGFEFGWEILYSWKDVKDIRERGCFHAIRDPRLTKALEELREKQAEGN